MTQAGIGLRDVQGKGLGLVYATKDIDNRIVLARTDTGTMRIDIDEMVSNPAATRFHLRDGQSTQDSPATEIAGYRIEFTKAVGQIIDIPADLHDLVIDTGILGDQPALIPLGDINGDGKADFISAVQDNRGGIDTLISFINARDEAENIACPENDPNHDDCVDAFEFSSHPADFVESIFGSDLFRRGPTSKQYAWRRFCFSGATSAAAVTFHLWVSIIHHLW